MEKENTFDESMMTAVDELSDEERKADPFIASAFFR